MREADLGDDYYDYVEDDAKPLGGTALRSCIQDQQALAVLQQSVQQDETAEMTFEQKAQLAGGINRLSSNHLAEVVRLIRENMPEGQGIEIDINTLDNRTLWKLHNFVRTCQAPAQLLLAAVACAASGTVRRVPVQQLRSCAIDELDLSDDFRGIDVTAAKLLGLMLPAATSLRSLKYATPFPCSSAPIGTPHHQPHSLLAVCEATASVPREQPLSPRASSATRRCNRWSGPLGARTRAPE